MIPQRTRKIQSMLSDNLAKFIFNSQVVGLRNYTCGGLIIMFTCLLPDLYPITITKVGLIYLVRSKN